MYVYNCFEDLDVGIQFDNFILQKIREKNLLVNSIQV